MEAAAPKFCQFCGQPEQIIWVHGHGQCAHCKTNSFPCCDGDECLVAEAPLLRQNEANGRLD